MNASPEAAIRRARVVSALEEAAKGRPVYLASPYSHAKAAERERRARAAARVAGELIRRGVVVFSPIAHGAALEAGAGLPRTWEFWRPQCHAMLAVCAAVAVLQLPGWSESVGVQAEATWAADRGMPVVRLEAGDWLPVDLARAAT